MPQQQNQEYIWDIQYQGYKFKFQGSQKPDETEVHKAYVDHISTLDQQPDPVQAMPSIDIGDMETEDARNERNSEEISFEADKIYKDGQFWDRFGESFWNAVSFVEPEQSYTKADEPWEIAAEASGGLVGAVTSMWGTHKIIGGVATPLKQPAFMKKIVEYDKLMKQARTAKKVGDATAAARLAKQAENLQRANPKLWRDSYLSKEGYKRVGLLGKSAIYTRAIGKMAVHSPKSARAANLFISNAATFTTYGQTKVFPTGSQWDKFETRMGQMGKDLRTSLVFSVAALPTPIGLTGKGIKYGVEPVLVFGAGAYSDLGTENLTWEERMIHGATLLAFHGLTRGFNESQVKENIGVAFRMTDPTLSEAKFRSIVDGKPMESILRTARGIVEKNPNYLLYTERADVNNVIKLLRFKSPKKKGDEPIAIYQDLSNGKVNELPKKDFFRKFSKNILQPRGEEMVGKELTKQEKVEVDALNDRQFKLREALESNRYGEPLPMKVRDVDSELISPFKKKVGLDEVKNWGDRIEKINNEEYRVRSENKTALSNPDWETKSPGLKAQLDKLEKARKTANIKINVAYRKVYETDIGEFDPTTDKFKIGDFVKIPKFDESSNSLDYSESGIGQYIGTMKDFKPGEVIAPDWMQKEPTRYTNYFKDIPVFEVKTKKGSETVRVALGGKVPQKVNEAIESANKADKPLVQYAIDDPKMISISQNPIILSTGGEKSKFAEASWNPKSDLFELLFMKARSDTPENRYSTTIFKEVEQPIPDSKQKEAAMNIGLDKEDKRGALVDFHSVRREVLSYIKSWDEGSGGRKQAMADANRYVQASPNPYIRAAKKASLQPNMNPLSTDAFKEIYENAVDLGYNGGPIELYDFFENFQLMETATVGETFVARPPNSLGKIKLSDGSKAFPRGTLSPELGMRLEADNIRRISESLREKRDKEIAKFSQFKEADVSNWPDMNKMTKNQPLKKDVLESNPEFDPHYDKPYGLKLQWDARTLDKIEQKELILNRNGEALRFKTKEEAMDAIADHWVNAESVEKMIRNNVADIESILGPEYTLWKTQQRRLNTARGKSGLDESDQKLLLREIFPESKGTSSLMTFEELEVATLLFDNPKISESYNQMISSILPPADVMFSTKPKLRKLLIALQEGALPTYTVNMLQKSRAAFDLGRKQMFFEIRRERNSGTFASYLHNIEKLYFKGKAGEGLKKKDLRDVTYLVDPLFKDFYPVKMDKYAVDDIIDYHNNKLDEIIAEMLIKNGVEVRNASTPNLEHQLIFESYTADGKQIELLTPYDAIRVTKGIKFRDSGGNVKRPPDEKYVKKIVDGEPVYGKQIPMFYLKSLRKTDRATGIVDNGWFIIGKERFVPKWDGDNFVTIERYKSNMVETSDGKWVKMHTKDGKPGKPRHHIVNEFLTRSITKQFKDSFVDPVFQENLVGWFASLDPEIAKMGISMLKKRMVAKRKIAHINQFIANTGGVYGTIYSRVGKLPPVFAFEKGTKRLILINRFKDVNGKPISKGSEVIDINGEKKTVGKMMWVYETDYTKLMSTYAQRTSHIAATYEIFGRGGAENKSIMGDKDTPGLRDRLVKETSEDYANWAIDQLRLQVNTADQIKLYEKILMETAGATAKLILSTPRSGGKNLFLGQGMNVTVFGYRQTVNGLSQWLRNPRHMLEKARKSGALVAGVHELITGKGYSKYWTGFMYPTEIANRTTSIAISESALKAHIDNLNGIKTIMNMGVSVDTSLRLLSDGTKFTDAEIADMKQLGSENIHERPDYLDQAEFWSHAGTQGVPNLPFVPAWMGKRWLKPFTLFYRIAYRITDTVWNLAIRPLATRGNPMPLLRYVSTMMMSAKGIALLTYLMLDKDTKNKFKSGAAQWYDDLLRAEWLGVFSNAFDEHGNVIDSYWPAIGKVVASVYNNINFIRTGQKRPEMAIDDAAREIIIGYNDLRSFIERKSQPKRHKYNKSKRRQNQFMKEYFRDEEYTVDETDYLNANSPSTRDLINAFWTDDPELQAKMYWSALHQRMAHDLGKDPALKKSKRKIRKKHMGHLKSIITRQRPIPNKWRERTTGKKTKYDLYMSLLDKEGRASELEIERIFQEQHHKFWKATRDYSHEFWGDPWVYEAE